MSTSAISSSAPVIQSVVAAKLKPTAPSAPSSAASPQATSAAALSAVTAALKEATETSAQTAREAGKGDRQALKLLARETAASAARSGGSVAASQSTITKGATINTKA